MEAVLFCLVVVVGYVIAGKILSRRRYRQLAKITRPKPRYRARRGVAVRTVQPVDVVSEIYGAASVTDGDSIVINKTQIRLFGIDAPELDHPYGKKAKWELVNLCKGQKIRAVLVASDHFDRAVANCFLPDGRDLSEEMVKIGMAIDWPKFSGGKYAHLEVAGIRKKLWLADARQKGRIHVWESFEANRK